MTMLLDRAVDAVRRLPPDVQDEIAQAMLTLASDDGAGVIELTPDERSALARSRAAAACGEFATAAEVEAVWAKHKL